MNDWMDKFISQCLRDVPHGKYRSRIEKELRDHMQTLRQSLPESEVLRAMGDPERLRKEYYVAWKQLPLSRANWIVTSDIAIGALIFVCGALLEAFDLTRGAALAALFLIPFSLVAALERNPWMMPYLCLSFAGCLVLGWLFGQKKKGRLA